jgi:hypothetical protein
LTRLVEDLASDDFEKLRAEIAKVWGPVRLANEIQRVRSVFKYGFEAGLLTAPMRFGPQFKKPSKSVLRKARPVEGHDRPRAGMAFPNRAGRISENRVLA